MNIFFPVLFQLNFQANMLMVNLAISDLCIFCSQGPLMFINAFASDFWMYGTLWCQLYGCTGGIFGNFFPLPIYLLYIYMVQCNLTFAGTCSIITLVFIAYDRYHVIVYGIAHADQRITTRKAALIITFIWIYSVVACIPPFFGWGGYKLGIVIVHTGTQGSYTFAHYIFGCYTFGS